jgi:four helix bundle protein
LKADGSFQKSEGRSQSAEVKLELVTYVTDIYLSLCNICNMANAEDLRLRTKRFALCILRLYRLLPYREEARVIGKQLLRSGTSVGANYRAACRARSRAEFIAKIGVVLEEADETAFWLELLTDAKILPDEELANLLKEANELTAIFVASLRTAKGLAA